MCVGKKRNLEFAANDQQLCEATEGLDCVGRWFCKGVVMCQYFF